MQQRNGMSIYSIQYCERIWSTVKPKLAVCTRGKNYDEFFVHLYLYSAQALFCVFSSK